MIPVFSEQSECPSTAKDENHASQAGPPALPARSPIVAIDTLGCKLNQAESETLARTFLEKGFRLGHAGEGCDVYILNTCTVTHVADRKARRLLRLARRRNPGALIVAAGCMAERERDRGAGLTEADIIAGNADKDHLPSKIAQLLNVQALAEPAPTFHASQWGRTRAMVKIQEGCSQSCTYCIVPAVRGNGRSLSPSGIVAQIESLVAGGYREIVLTGTNIGAYKAGGINLAGLLRSILHETSVERLRVSSLQPQEISPDLLSLWQAPRLCRHVHMPLQSGSASILRAMKRRYDSGRFRQTVHMLRTIAPEVAITTDIIVGFPGETQADFEQTEQLCKDVRFARIHAFPYSPRPGTPAAAMPDRVATAVQEERLARVLALAAESRRRFQEGFLGKTMPVLWERPVKGQKDLWSGLTDNYIRVYAVTATDLLNRILPARLVAIREGKVFGELSLPL